MFYSGKERLFDDKATRRRASSSVGHPGILEFGVSLIPPNRFRPLARRDGANALDLSVARWKA